MSNVFALDFQINVATPADAGRIQSMNDLLGSFPNPVELTCLREGAAFSSKLKVRASGGIGLMELRCEVPAGSDACFLSARTKPVIARNQSFEYNIVLWQGSETSMLTGKRNQLARAGDMAIMGNDTPGHIQPRSWIHAYNLSLPASWERVGDTRMENTMGKIFAGRERSNHALVNFAKSLIAQEDGMAMPGMEAKLYDIIALTLNPRATSEHRVGLLAMLHNHIEQYFADSDLTPGKVAATFNISVRYLHQLFASSGTTFTEYLTRQRLARARQMLSDPLYRHRTIFGIAFDCGFRDINHFGRRFKERFGSTPGELRRSALVG